VFSSVAAVFLSGLVFFSAPRMSLAAGFRIARELESDVVGDIRYSTAEYEDTLVDIARKYSLGYEEIIAANPGISRWVPGKGTRIVLPTMYVLPDAPRRGIVLNLPELRLYFFPKMKDGDAQIVVTYPVSVGRMDWKTPLGETKVVRKDKDPPWYPPKSIRAEHAAEGEVLPKFIPGGDPENPLGRFALRLGITGYLIHGVDERKASGIGMRVTHGCIRMYPEDIKKLFAAVETGTVVKLVDQPIKAGWRGSTLFLEVHQAMEEDEQDHARVTFEDAEATLLRISDGRAKIDWPLVRKMIEQPDGIPQAVGQVKDYASLFR
jgi:L,D-transpeptidase ErfK/SrfK